ncbi:hypothetical protein RYR31_003679 [Aeromonas dhakensis]|nr:hypothetical protein [Aeromonas dhakensis]
MMKPALLLSSFAIISGCSSNIYYNPYIESDSQRAMQLEIDDGYCTSVSVGAVPMPEVRHYDSGARIYTFNANVYQAGMPTSNISGYGSVSQSPADAFSSGFANGAAIGSAMRASMDRDTVYDGCMASLGWTTSKDISNAIYAERQNASRQATETIQNDVPAPVLNAINNTAYLKKWYYEKSPKFDYAVDVDDKLKADPDWSNKSLEERFAEATRLTRIHFGEISQ